MPNTGNLNNGIVYVNTPGLSARDNLWQRHPVGAARGFCLFRHPKTVIRGGFGLFYNVRARSGQEGDLANNAPTTNSVTQFYSSTNPNNTYGAGYYAATGVGALNGPLSIGHAIPLHSPIPCTRNKPA